MPSCLGLYTDKNLIKYAKVTSDKTSGKFTVDSYGVKFYDNMLAAIEEIVDETGIGNGPIGLSLATEDYFNTQVFSTLRRKDMTDLIVTEYNENIQKRNIPMAVVDMRFKLAKNIGVLDKNIAICVLASKTELAKMLQTYESYKLASIEPLSVSVKNLFVNEGIDEEAIVVNIEERTTVTIFHRSEIQRIETIAIGFQEILLGLAEKYNSIPKAYEACKKVSAYLDDLTDIDDESRDILDVLIPVIYDIRQKTEDISKPFKKDLKNIYITGSGAIINNIDLYFRQIFVDVDCQVVMPFFMRKDASDLKDVIEVNSAIALALDGLGMADEELDFNRNAKKAAGFSSIKELARRYKLDEKKAELIKKKNQLVDKVKDVFKKLNTPTKKKRKKAKVDFEDGGEASNLVNAEKEHNSLSVMGILDTWLTRLAVLVVSAFIIYSVAAVYTSKVIADKTSEVTTEISKNNAIITSANKDAEYLNGLADGYVTIKEKLSTLMAKIQEETMRAFDIPNFLSKLMFIMPVNVRITSIDVNKTGNVIIKAESGQYAELGYFVSRVKLENLLLDVDMEVVSVEADIKIIVSGVLP